MTYKTFKFEVLVDVEFEGEFDPRYIQEALFFGYERMSDEGYLTADDDETTVCGQMQCNFCGEVELCT